MVVADFKSISTAARRHPLFAAFLASLVIHATLYGGWMVGNRLGLWDHQATWLLTLLSKKGPVPVTLRAPQEPIQPKIIPLTFAEVDPATAVQEPPKDTEYYGALSSLASNPKPGPQESEKPKID